MLSPSLALHKGRTLTLGLYKTQRCFPLRLSRLDAIAAFSTQGQCWPAAASTLASPAFTRHSSTVAKPLKRNWASTKSYRNEDEVKHKGIFLGLQTAQALHKPPGWSKDLEDFTSQPYQSGKDLRTERRLPIPRVWPHSCSRYLRDLVLEQGYSKTHIYQNHIYQNDVKMALDYKISAMQEARTPHWSGGEEAAELLPD